MTDTTKETIIKLFTNSRSSTNDITEEHISNLSTIITLLLNNEEYELHDIEHDAHYSGVTMESGKPICSNCHCSNLKTDLIFHATTDDYEVFIYKCLNCGNYLFKKEVSELKVACKQKMN